MFLLSKAGYDTGKDGSTGEMEGGTEGGEKSVCLYLVR